MPEQPWVLDEPEGHLWYFRLDLPGHDHNSEWTKPYLDVSERQRYERFLSPARRHQFGTGRVLLKRVLARYLSQPPEAIRLLYTDQRKPFLAGNLAFNLSHAGPYLLVAVARRAVGVDIQEECSVCPEDVLRGFSAEERVRVRPEGLFTYWVLKEAWWKADHRALRTTLLLDAVTSKSWRACPLFSVRIGTWRLGYLRLRPGLHLGWAVAHPQPIWKLRSIPYYLHQDKFSNICHTKY